MERRCSAGRDACGGCSRTARARRNEVKLLATGYVGLWLDLVRFLRPGPGSGDAPTCSPPPRTGSARTTRRRHRASSVSCSATSEPSGRRRLVTSPAGPECVRDISCPFSSASGYGASGTREAASSSTSRVSPCRIPRRRRPCAFSEFGTRRCSSTRGGRASCLRDTGGFRPNLPCRWRRRRNLALREGRIALEPFRRLAWDARRELDAEAERLAELYS